MLEPEGPGVDARAMLLQESSAAGRVVRGEDLADRIEGDLGVAHPGARPGRHELLTPVPAVARERVDPGGPEEVELVVVHRE